MSSIESWRLKAFMNNTIGKDILYCMTIPILIRPATGPLVLQNFTYMCMTKTQRQPLA